MMKDGRKTDQEKSIGVQLKNSLPRNTSWDLEGHEACYLDEWGTYAG